MQVINIKNGIEIGITGAVIAIGNFDGVHKGHAEVIKRVRDIGQKEKRPCGVLTFEPHPISVFAPKLSNYRLTPFDLKMKMLNDMGLDFVAYGEFNQAFAQISANDFVEKILVNKLKVAEVLTGDDFIFGHNREGNVELMKQLAAKFGFKYGVVSEVKNSGGARFSSSLARELIRQGKVKEAAEILGRNYTIEGKVIKGIKAAREQLGYATANIEMGEFVIPKFGVYEVVVKVEGEQKKGVANIGVKPTYGDNKPLLEVHIFDFDQDIYGKDVFVELISFIRDEKKFNSVAELKEQIRKDVESVR
jgi:riboflavin kinase/FMN adenylyltransferase